MTRYDLLKSNNVKFKCFWNVNNAIDPASYAAAGLFTWPRDTEDMPLIAVARRSLSVNLPAFPLEVEEGDYLKTMVLSWLIASGSRMMGIMGQWNPSTTWSWNCLANTASLEGKVIR